MSNDAKEVTTKVNVGETYLAGVSAPPVTDAETEYIDASTGKSAGKFHMDIERVTRHGVSLVRKDKWVEPKQKSPDLDPTVGNKTGTTPPVTPPVTPPKK